MELRVLHYFLAIAREENMTRAAQMLHISQPALSRQMMQLEAELGVKLFTRSNHNIVLTEDGLLLKRRAQELLSLADKTKRDFLHRDTELAGEITIGSGESAVTITAKGGKLYWDMADMFGMSDMPVTIEAVFVQA